MSFRSEIHAYHLLAQSEHTEEQVITKHDKGVRRLFAAMIFRAIADLYLQDPGLSQDAREWIESDEFRDWSFAWVCHHLHIEPDAVRDRISRINTRKLAKAAACDSWIE